MGIDGLWKVCRSLLLFHQYIALNIPQMIQPTQQLYHLNDLSHMNGYSERKKGNILKVGVDIR